MATNYLFKQDPMRDTGWESDPVEPSVSLPPMDFARAMDAHSSDLSLMRTTGLEPLPERPAWMDVPNSWRAGGGGAGADFRLAKAVSTSLHSHFKKSVKHNTALSEHHASMRDAHLAQHDHHRDMAKVAGMSADMQEHHRVTAAFHKTMAGHHAVCMKEHSDHSEHCSSMAESCKGG